MGKRGRAEKHPVIDYHKVCLKCEVNKPIDLFFKVRIQDGYCPYCNDCDRERQRSKKRVGRNLNPDYRANRNKLMRYHNSLRRKSVKTQVVSESHKSLIKEFYNNTPEKMVVDHVVPLVSDDVCGLHVPWNLQYLDNHQNSVKNNLFDGTSNNESWKQRLQGVSY